MIILSMECGDEYCWYFKVTFTEVNGIRATVEHIEGSATSSDDITNPNRVRFYWFPTTDAIVIPPYGINTYSGGLRLRSGTRIQSAFVFRIRFEGHDENGNLFSGDTEILLWMGTLTPFAPTP